MTTRTSSASSTTSEGDPARTNPESAISYRQPTRTDARGVHELVQHSGGGLDCNSRYAYILICDHFSETSVVAECAGRIVGVATAYLKPAQPDTLFIWQVGVDPAGRGRGVGKRLLHELMRRPACRAVRVIETTVGPSNAASRGMFKALAKAIGAAIEEQPGYQPELFTPDVHEAEALLRLAPVNVRALSHS